MIAILCLVEDLTILVRTGGPGLGDLEGNPDILLLKESSGGQ